MWPPESMGMGTVNREALASFGFETTHTRRASVVHCQVDHMLRKIHHLNPFTVTVISHLPRFSFTRTLLTDIQFTKDGWAKWQSPNLISWRFSHMLSLRGRTSWLLDDPATTDILRVSIKIGRIWSKHLFWRRPIRCRLEWEYGGVIADVS